MYISYRSSIKISVIVNNHDNDERYQLLNQHLFYPFLIIYIDHKFDIFKFVTCKK